MRRLADYNPGAITAYFLTVAGIAMFSMDPVILLLSVFGGITCFLLMDRFRGCKTHLYMLGVFFVMTIINPLVSHNGKTVLFVMNRQPVTLEALIYGMFAAVMVVSVFYWFRAFTLIMTSDKLLYVFGSLSPGLALILSMTLRYIPLFSDQARKVKNAQRALGMYKEDNVVDSIRGGMRIFSVMVTWTLENGIITADSMAARGYGTGKRTLFSLFQWKKKDILLLIMTILLALITLLMPKTGYSYYPQFSFSLGTIYAWISYAAYGMLAATPLIIETREFIKWRFLLSKM